MIVRLRGNFCRTLAIVREGPGTNINCRQIPRARSDHLTCTAPSGLMPYARPLNYFGHELKRR